MLPSVTRDPESLVVRTDIGDQIHYLDWGSPQSAQLPPIALVHGLGATAWDWSPVARRLAESAHVVAVDLRLFVAADALLRAAHPEELELLLNAPRAT